MKDKVITCLKIKSCYTKDLYNELGGKESLNLSLNKFRAYLFELEDCGLIEYDTRGTFPRWNIRSK